VTCKSGPNFSQEKTKRSIAPRERVEWEKVEKGGKKTIEEDRNLDNENIGSGMARVDFQPHQPQ
jgi:hypothetical protein